MRLELRRTLRELPAEVPVVLGFVLRGGGRSGTSVADRLRLLARFYRITASVPCAHKQSEMVRIVEALFALDPSTEGCVVEAGSYKGGSAAKLSLACAIVGRRLVVFDSFEGLPDNDEVMEAAEVLELGARGPAARGPDRFEAGAYRGTRQEVERTLEVHGSFDVCELVPGRFEETMPGFDRDVALAFLDVDLASSTRTCLTCLVPRLVPGGELFSHDGHLPLVREVFLDSALWERLGLAPPRVEGLGRRRLIRVRRGR